MSRDEEVHAAVDTDIDSVRRVFLCVPFSNDEPFEVGDYTVLDQDVKVGWFRFSSLGSVYKDWILLLNSGESRLTFIL